MILYPSVHASIRVAQTLCSGSRAGNLQESCEHFAGIEELFRNFPGPAAVPWIIPIHALHTDDRFLDCCESKQSLAGTDLRVEAGVLNEGGFAAGQIADGPVAEPAAARIDICSMGEGKFRT